MKDEIVMRVRPLEYVPAPWQNGELVPLAEVDCVDQAVKVLEEAREVVDAAVELLRAKSHGSGQVAGAMYGQCLADEVADVITAAVDLASVAGLDLPAALGRCERRNRMRGRYGK